jgi:hypothetical protein
MSQSRQRSVSPTAVSIGFAVSERGDGIAYARIRARGSQSVERLTFRVDPSQGLAERTGAYGALRAAASLLHRRGAKAVTFLVEDPAIVADLEERRPLPQVLTLPYVALRCSLNRFGSATVVPAAPDDVVELSARARAEVALAVAA